MRENTWESKEIAGFFWFRSELSDALPEKELEHLVNYFMVVYEAWNRNFGAKTLRAPMFRFRQSVQDPTHLKIQMLRMNDDTLDDAIIAEKAVCVVGSGNSLSLVLL
jgi:hypothetical protein